MAFGVALFVPLGMEAAAGAFAGLVGAAAASLCSTLASGTRGLISAPTGPMLVLLTGAAASLTAGGVEGISVFAGLAAVMLVSGVVMGMLGLTGGGRLIKFMPYPVIAGFMTGSGILMVMSQTGPVSGGGVIEFWSGWRWLPAGAAVATIAAMYYLPKKFPRLPNTIAGLIVGTATFQLLTLSVPQPIPQAWVIGALPGIESLQAGVSLATLQGLPLSIVVGSGLALALLASLDTLLTSVVADVNTGARHDARRELLGQGAGQICAALLGGMAAAGATGATLVAVKTGGRRWAGAFAGATFAMLVLWIGPAGRLLPISVLAGIIIYVAWAMLERDLLVWLRTPEARMDAGIAILVTTVTVAYDLMIAVGLGVTIAIIQFVRDQVAAPVVHRRSEGSQSRSVRRRTQAENTILAEHGNRIVLYELRGNLFFASAERLFSELLLDLDRPAFVILHLRRVHRVDLTGIKLLEQIAERLHAHGGELIFCDVHSGIGLGHDVGQALAQVSPRSVKLKIKTFNASDEAMEYAEDALLAALSYQTAPPRQRIELADSDLGTLLQPGQLQALHSIMRPHSFAVGQQIFVQGEAGDELYFVIRGEIDVRLPTTAHHYKRLAKLGPGMVLGEIAFLEAAIRTATAVAVLPCEVLVLDRAGFERLQQQHPDAAVGLLLSLSKIISERLRWADGEVQRLAQW
jgi:SulP family sulfate permease